MTINRTTLCIIGVFGVLIFILLIVDISLKLKNNQTPPTKEFHESRAHQQKLHQQEQLYGDNDDIPTAKSSLANRKVPKSECTHQQIYCADVFKKATQGHWSVNEQLNSPWQQPDVREVRDIIGLPKEMTRPDYR